MRDASVTVTCVALALRGAACRALVRPTRRETNTNKMQMAGTTPGHDVIRDSAGVSVADSSVPFARRGMVCRPIVGNRDHVFGLRSVAGMTNTVLLLLRDVINFDVMGLLFRAQRAHISACKSLSRCHSPKGQYDRPQPPHYALPVRRASANQNQLKLRYLVPMPSTTASAVIRYGGVEIAVNRV